MVDDRAGLHFLARPNLDAGLDDRIFTDHRSIPHHSAFKHNCACLQTALPANDATVQFNSLTDVTITPNDATVSQGAVIQNAIVADHSRAVNLYALFDLHPSPQVNWAQKLRVRGNVNRSPGPNAPADVPAEFAQMKAAVK